MVVPVTHEYRSGRGDTGLQQLRNSVAYEELDKVSDTMAAVTALQARQQKMSVTNFPTITTDTSHNYVPLAVDEDEGVVLARNAYHSFGTVDPSDGSYTELVDITATAPFKTYYDLDSSNVDIQNAQCLPNGNWIVSLGRNVAALGGIDAGRLFLSTDKGSTWTLVLQMTAGYHSYFAGYGNVSGERIVVGEYRDIGIRAATPSAAGDTITCTTSNPFTNGDAVCIKSPSGATLPAPLVSGTVYYVRDVSSLTLKLAATAGGDAIDITGAETTDLWIAMSEGARRVYLSNDSGATWSTLYNPGLATMTHIHALCFDPNDSDKLLMSLGDGAFRGLYPLTISTGAIGTIIAAVQPTVLYPYGKKVWMGHDGGSSNGAIQVYDTATGSLVRGWYPFDLGSTPNFYDPNTMGDPYIFGIKHYGGVFYAACYNVTDLRYGGLLVSADGYRWTFLRRLTGAGNYGAQGVAGVVGGQIFWWSVIGTVGRMSYCMAPAVKVNQCVIAERACTPLLTEDQSDLFDTSVGGWTKAGDVATLAQDATHGINGGKCLKLTMGASSSGYGIARSVNTLAATNGQYITVIAYVKPGALWGYQSQVNLRIYSSTSNRILSPSSSTRAQIGSGWTRIMAFGKVDGGDLTNGQIYLYVDKVDTGNNVVPTGAVLYIDRIQAYASSVGYLQSDHWQVGGTNRVDEIPSYPIVGGGAAWSVSFSWFPQNGYQAINADVPVCSILGSDGVNLVLSWIQSTTYLSGTDGTNTVATNNATTLFEKEDQINICITSNGTNSILYVQDPINGNVSAETLTAVNLTGVPVSLLLGSNADKSSVGIGAFTNVRVYDTQLSAANVAESFRLTSRGWKIDANSKSIYSRLVDA